MRLAVCDLKDKRVHEKHFAKLNIFFSALRNDLGDILDIDACSCAIYKLLEEHPPVRTIRTYCAVVPVV